ncbi:MAG: DUF4091 domain-containing protein [Clostridia bacterium]|nr:DUF4091 domain-containing protein [Clostridia bacterium]
MRIKTISSLEKCFLTETVSQKQEFTKASCLKNELFHFEICYQASPEIGTGYAYLSVESEIKEYVRVCRIEPVPVQLAAGPNSDDIFISKQPGLYPDVMQPLEPNGRLAVANNLRSLMVEIDPQGKIEPGIYPITFCFDYEHLFRTEKNGRYSVTFNLEIIDAFLPEQDLKFTQWFHCDSLKRYYNTEAFDDRHFEIIENFAKTAVKYGVNMLLTPVFTLALDTYVGGERDTMQLVGVALENGIYSFDFSLLDRWVEMCNRIGIKYFEIAHFFTQWGAKAAPKIMATVDGEYKKLFGWETDALSDEYADFLRAFIPSFLAHMKQLDGADKRCWFHISDEPNEKQLEGYLKAKAIVEPLVEGYPIMDALSSFDFYSSGAVKQPVVSISHIAKFIENKVPDLWGYYCLTEDREGFSNRLVAMPSFRNRILGTQLYKFDIKGFLHWGYNFYFNQFSYASVNPFMNTDGEYFAASGDALSVYPGPDGCPWESIRLLVFFDGLQDMRAFKLCEQLYGKEYVLGIIEQEKEAVDFKSYPREAEYLLKTREKINRAIAKYREN